jgi:hypothetical protein
MVRSGMLTCACTCMAEKRQRWDMPLTSAMAKRSYKLLICGHRCLCVGPNSYPVEEQMRSSLDAAEPGSTQEDAGSAGQTREFVMPYK